MEYNVTLRNALCRELETMTGREDWYAVFPTTPGLTRLSKQMSGRHESITPSKIVAELTFGFWVSLLNSEYERLLWKDLRRAFPFMPKKDRQRKNVSAPLNTFRTFRNRVFHNESICWNLDRAGWLSQIDRFNTVCDNIRMAIGWKK